MGSFIKIISSLVYHMQTNSNSELNSLINYSAYITEIVVQLKSYPCEIFCLIRQFCLAEIVDAFYRYEPMWNYRFLYKTIYLLELYMYSASPQLVSLDNKADIDQKLEPPTREYAAYLAYAAMGVIMSDVELTDIILSKRFEPVNKNLYNELFASIKSRVYDQLIPRYTPYDLNEQQIENLKLWNNLPDAIKHVLNIFNYIINASLQRDWCAITFTAQTLQYAALRLALKYFTKDIDGSLEISLRTLKSILSSEDFIIARKRIEACCEILEEEMINTMKVVNENKSAGSNTQ